MFAAHQSSFSITIQPLASWLIVAAACFAFVGCDSGGSLPQPIPSSGNETPISGAGGAPGSAGGSVSSSGGTVASGGGTASGGSESALERNYGWPSEEAPYLACALPSEKGNAPLIADFNQEQSLVGNSGEGLWYAYDDFTVGEFSWATGASSDSAQGEPGQAMQVTASGWTDWGTGFAVALGPALGADSRCAYDAAGYAGVSFWAKGSGTFRAMLGTIDNTPVDEGGSCTGGEDCYDRPGLGVELSDQWQLYELPFCFLLPEGWGSAPASITPSALVELHFRIAGGQNFELWMDNLEFFTEADAQNTVVCRGSCPLDAPPEPTNIDPESTYLTLPDNLSLHTFEQETVECGPITRRYLSHVPAALAASSDAPVLFALHGHGANAESFWEIQTHGKCDELADRDGFIVIYGNAAPGAASSPDPDFLNSGAWRTTGNDDGQVDDIEYLRRVLADLEERLIISGGNDIYIMGQSNGGGMTLDAAKKMPNTFKGIAPFMPYVGTEDEVMPPPSSDDSLLSRVLFVYSDIDPGLPASYLDILSLRPPLWAAALGLSKEAAENPTSRELPDVIVEGENYAGDFTAALDTRNSTVTQWDYQDPEADASVRVLSIKNGGHFWPNAIQDSDDWALQSWGLRNQDFDGCEAAWGYFMSD